jgi:hypothetical protein
LPDDSIGPDGSSDILEVLLAEICELNPYFTPDLIVGRRRNADAAWLRDTLKPCCNVDAISKDVMRLDNDVTDIYADAEGYNSILHFSECKLPNASLEFHGSSNGFYRTRKFRQQPVAGVLHDATAMLSDCRFNGVRQERGKFGMRVLFVDVHEPRITGHVGGQYRRQPALDPDWPLLHHGLQSNVAASIIRITEDAYAG